MIYDDQFVHSYDRKLIDANKAIWKSNILNEKNKYIVVFHGLPDEYEMCLYENLIAKGLQQKEKLAVVAVQDWKNRRTIGELDRAFQYEEEELNCNNDEVDLIADKIVENCYGNIDAILNLTYRGIQFGDFVYDYMMRTQVNGVFDWKKIGKSQYRDAISLSIKSIDAAYTLFEQYAPEYVVTTEFLMAKGTIIKVAQKKGAKLLASDFNMAGRNALIEPTRKIGENLKICDMVTAMIENAYQENEMTENLFVISNSNANKQLTGEKGKRNVFILLHALGDVPRMASYQHVYHDYAEWYEDTLKYIRNKKDVNWYIKDHPLAAWYGQQQFVRDLYEKYKSDNILWCDKDVSGMMVKNIADCVITVSGDAGIEYWSYGIPTVTLAKTYYSDWGISYNIKSKEEYYEVLDNISELKKPSIQQMEYAKTKLNTYLSLRKGEDELGRLFSTTRKRQIQEYSKCDVWNYDIHYEFVEKFVEYLNKYDIRKSPCFTLEHTYEVK